jgi:hypothetical protein
MNKSFKIYETRLNKTLEGGLNLCSTDDLQ